jgi:hypothetical protein
MKMGTRRAVAPFEFYTLAQVTRPENHSASTLGELLDALEKCSDESIFHHAVQAPGSHELLAAGGSNDFAKWVDGSVMRIDLAGRLVELDQRNYMSIDALRRDLYETVREYLAEFPEAADQPARETFQFREGMDLRVPTELSARTLEELRASIEVMRKESFYLHFIAPRTRFEQQSNDFSVWLKESLGLGALADELNKIDIAESTLEGVQAQVLKLIEAELETRN